MKKLFRQFFVGIGTPKACILDLKSRCRGRNRDLISPSSLWFLTLISPFFLFCANLPAQITPTPSLPTPGRQVIHGHIPTDVNISKKIGRLPPDQRFCLTVGLPIKEPNNTYPSKEEYGELIRFLKGNGFKVVDTVSNRLSVALSAKVIDVEKTFHIQLLKYQRSDGSVFFAPDREPSVDLDVPILHIGGLDNAIIPHPGG
jgi:hypothetical protein